MQKYVWRLERLGLQDVEKHKKARAYALTDVEKNKKARVYALTDVEKYKKTRLEHLERKNRGFAP